MGPLTLQLRPELVLAENSKYQVFPESYDDSYWNIYSVYANMVDIPSRFGDGYYKKINWGQSSLRLNLGPVSLGLSNENLWWGPGVRNSLILSNNASGFKHITINSTKPIRTAIGSIESQIIAGKLQSSGYYPPGVNKGHYIPKNADWRYLSGIIVTYHPKWVPGLFLGGTRVFNMYRDHLGKKIGNFLPLFTPYEKDKLVNEDNEGRDQLTSLFARWCWYESNAEVYVEFGRNDHSHNLRDFMLEPEHSRSYLAGMRKIFKLAKQEGELIDLGFELIQMGQTNTFVYRASGPWYVHSIVRDGYTNEGQILGAGSGIGTNVQTVYLSWRKGLSRLGGQFERIEHNADFYRQAFPGQDRKWIDHAIAAVGEWDYKNMLFNTKLNFIRSSNYEWQKNKNILNCEMQLGVTYRFN